MNQFLPFVINHWQLFSALILVLMGIVVIEIKNQANSLVITPQVAVEWINHQQAIVIDIRNQEAFAKGHIIHSKSILANNVIMALTQGKEAEKYKNNPILIVCARGLQAEKTATLLRKEGFQKVAVLKGGIENWVATDLPLEKNK